jgi:hypothetical protein
MDNEYGWVPDSVDIVNEPNNSKGWDATKVGNAIVATSSRLAGHGYQPAFIAPSSVSVSAAVDWFDDMVINVPESLQYLDELSYHCYRGCDDDNNLIDVGDRTLQYGISSSQTEKIRHDYEALHRDLKLARVSAWEQFALAYPVQDNGAQYYWIDNSDANNPTVHIGSRTKFLRQYFKYIRAGAVRIDAATTNNSFDPLAFINSDGGHVVVIKADNSGSFSIEGLPAGTYGIKYTTPSEYDVDLTDTTISNGQSLNTSIPAKGALTVYARGSSPPPTATATPIPPEYDESTFLPFVDKSSDGIAGAESQKRTCSKK